MCPPLLAAIPGAVALGGALGSSAAMGGLVIAGTAMSAVSAGMQYVGQQQAARAQGAAWHEQARLVNEDLNLKYQQLHLREMQERESFAQQSMEITRRSMQAMGYTQAVAGAAGVQGNAVNMLMMDFGRQQAEAMAALQRNREMRAEQFSLEALGYQQQGIATIHGGAPTTSPPSILSPILQTAGAGLNFMAMGLGPGTGGGGGTGPQTWGPTYGRPASPSVFRTLGWGGGVL